jgi:hypothetical protein
MKTESKNQMVPSDLQKYRIPIESEIWDLFLNDKFYKEQADEIHDCYYNLTFEEKYNELKSKFREITGKTKETWIIQDLYTRFGLKHQIFIFEGDFYQGTTTIVCYHFDQASIYIVSKPIIKLCFEWELIPIFAHSIGHIIFSSPILTPDHYLLRILHEERFTERTKEIEKLLILAKLLRHITEYNADRLIVLATNSFELPVSALLKIKRIGYRYKFKDIDIVYLIRNQCAEDEITVPAALEDTHPCISDRILAMFLFCKEHGFLEKSYDQKNIKAKTDLDELLNHEKIVEEYNKLNREP